MNLNSCLMLWPHVINLHSCLMLWSHDHGLCSGVRVRTSSEKLWRRFQSTKSNQKRWAYTFLKVFYCTGISFLESILQEFTFLKVQYVLLQKFTFIKRSLLEFTFFSSAVYWVSSAHTAFGIRNFGNLQLAVPNTTYGLGRQNLGLRTMAIWIWD